MLLTACVPRRPPDAAHDDATASRAERAASPVMEIVAPSPEPLSSSPRIVPPMADTSATGRSAAEEVATSPRPLRRTEPRYPPELAGEGRDGRVVARFFVGIDGRAESVEIVRSSDPAFSRAVREALPSWRFEPARGKDGRALRAQAQLLFSFVAQP